MFLFHDAAGNRFAPPRVPYLWEEKMRTLVLLMTIGAIFLLAACGDPAANNNSANRPANTANNSANGSASAPANTAAVEAEIRKLVTDTAAALAKNDAATLENLYSDNYMLVNLDGSVQTKAERLASFRSGETKFESFTYDEVSVRTNPEGTGAVVIARAAAKGTNKGMPITGNVRVTQVWSKTPSGWKQVSGHAVSIASGSTSAPNLNTNSNR
jgi:ketosteroid isomerase-like protein